MALVTAAQANKIHIKRQIDFTYKGYHKILVFLCLTYFTQDDNLQDHPCHCKWHLINYTNETIYKTEIELQMQKPNLWFPRGKMLGRRINWETGIDIYTLLHVKQITNKNLLYSTGNSIMTYISSIQFSSVSQLCMTL